MANIHIKFYSEMKIFLSPNSFASTSLLFNLFFVSRFHGFVVSSGDVIVSPNKVGRSNLFNLIVMLLID